MKVKVISLPYIFQVLYVLCFTGPRYQVSVYRTNGPLVGYVYIRKSQESAQICDIFGGKQSQFALISEEFTLLVFVSLLIYVHTEANEAHNGKPA